MYAYRCYACGHAFDIHQSFAEGSLTVCPECQGQLRKVFGTVGVTFNGSGFYRTDSRAGNGGKSGKGGDTASSSKGSSSDSSSAKPSNTSSPSSSSSSSGTSSTPA